MRRKQPLARLDLVRNPFGPCPAALEVLEGGSVEDGAALASRLREQISERYRFPSHAVALTEDPESAIERLVAATSGPIVVFAPDTSVGNLERTFPSRSIVRIARDPGRREALSFELSSDLPSDGVAVVGSPSDPLGALLLVSDAVRLARACRLVVIDERFAEFSGFSLLSLALEFDNVVVVRSLSLWTGVDQSPVGWLAASSRTIAPQKQLLGPDFDLTRAAISATFDELPAVEATLRIVREERSRLFRLLRKFSFLQPLPSWGPFMAARVEFVPRADFVQGLCERGVIVHVPDGEGLDQFVRFGIGTRTEMELLRQALFDLAPALLEEFSQSGLGDAERFPLRVEQRFEPERREVDHVFEIAPAERASFRG